MSVHPQVQALLERVARSPLPPYHTVSPFVARRIYRDTRAALAPKAPELPEVRLLAFPNYAMRLYRPVRGETLPALIYFHRQVSFFQSHSEIREEPRGSYRERLWKPLRGTGH